MDLNVHDVFVVPSEVPELQPGSYYCVNINCTVIIIFWKVSFNYCIIHVPDTWFCNLINSISVFSSLKPFRAQVIFSDPNLSVVCHFGKLLTFLISPPEPWGRFLSDGDSSLFKCRTTPFQGDIIVIKQKLFIDIKESLSPEPMGQFHPNLA